MNTAEGQQPHAPEPLRGRVMRSDRPHEDPYRVLVGEPARIVVLNGVSSSGKTALLKAMQMQSKVPLHHIQLDAFRDMEPPGYWDGWERRNEASAQRMMGALCGAMYGAAIQYSCHGQQVVLDIALTNPHSRSLLVKYLADWPVYLMGVHCNVQELDKRECAPGDRGTGLAASQVEWLHKRMLYDFQVDTTDKQPEDLATEVLLWLANAPKASALGALRALQNAA